MVQVPARVRSVRTPTDRGGPRMDIRLPSSSDLIRAAAVACTLVYFVIGKVGFEPRLALGPVSLNQILQLGVIASLALMLWLGDLQWMIRSRTLWFVSTLALLLAVRAVGAQNSSYAPAKPLGYWGLVVPCFAVFAAALQRNADLRRFLTLWALVGTGMLALGLLLLLSGHAPPRLAVFGGGSNGFARMLGTAFLLWIGLDTRLGPRKLPVWLLTLPGFVAALLYAGGKTAVFGLGISIAISVFVRGQRRAGAAVLVGTALFAAAPLWTNALAKHADKNLGEVRMFLKPDTDDPRGSYGTRLYYYQRSLEYLHHPRIFGTGTGEWYSVVGLPSGRRHPHNMELEIACELGILGLTWLALVLLVSGRWLRTLFRRHSIPELFGALIAVLAFWLFNAQLNGDLLDNRWIWLSVLLLEILVAERPRATSLSMPWRVSAAGSAHFGAIPD